MPPQKPQGAPRGLVQINTDKLRAALLAIVPSQDDTEEVLRGVASAARQRWIKLAKEETKSTSRDYVQGIQEVEYRRRVARIDLLGTLPNMVEQGWPQTDLRKTLLGPGAKNVKTAKDGSRYAIIPFRHGAPGGGGRNVGAPMPKIIHAAAKKLAPTVSLPGLGGAKGIVLYGGRLLPSNTRKAVSEILNTKSKPWHTTSIYTGMIRQEKQYGKAKQSSYGTFRVISSKSRDKRSWIHPGIKARHLAQKVADSLGEDIQRAVASMTKKKKVPK